MDDKRDSEFANAMHLAGAAKEALPVIAQELSALREVAVAARTLAQMVRDVYIPDGQWISGPALAIDAAVNDLGSALADWDAGRCRTAQQGDDASHKQEEQP